VGGCEHPARVDQGTPAERLLRLHTVTKVTKVACTFVHW
jgi:hypothetical protein